MRLATKTGVVDISPEALRGLAVKWRGVNVEDQLALMALWLERHERQRPANIWRFIDNWMRKVKPVKPLLAEVEKAWWTSDQKTTAYGTHVGINARPGESMSEYRERLFDVFRKGRAA